MSDDSSLTILELKELLEIDGLEKEQNLCDMSKGGLGETNIVLVVVIENKKMYVQGSYPLCM